MSQLKATSKLSTTSHKRQSGKSMSKVAVVDLTLIDSDADPSPDSDSDIEILPSKKRSRTSSSLSSKPSTTKHLKVVQPDSNSKNHRATHQTEAVASARIGGRSEQGGSGVSGSKSSIKAKQNAAELDKADKARAFATELEATRKLRKEAAMAAEKLDKNTNATPKKMLKGGGGIVYLSVMDDKGQLLLGDDDDGDNLRHLAMVKEIFPAGSVGSSSSYGFLSLGGQMGFAMQIKTVTRFVNHTLLSRFEAAKQALKAAGRPTKEVMLFHGTGIDNIPKIMNEGFIVPRVEFGNGVWLARNPAISLGYCEGGGMMFICRVLPGLFSSRKDMGLGLGLGPGHAYGHGDSFEAGKGDCDSYSGSGGGDDIFVLPIYVVQFTSSMNQPFATPAPVYQPPPAPTDQYRTIINAGGYNFNSFF
ncbi:hypothetical protein RQP46_008729 [Phenoliferia psychrophenolica]